MKFSLHLIVLVFFLHNGLARGAEEPRLLTRVKPLPVALDPDFQFRKTKLFFLKEKAQAALRQQGKGAGKKAGVADAGQKSTTVGQDASVSFERKYRFFGAVTALDERQRLGDYFDFFWRSQHPADLTVRLEYRQENLHAHVQAQEISYANVRGSRRTEFKVVGDDYFDGGRVIAWRCCLIENGRIVAENHSFLWE